MGMEESRAAERLVGTCRMGVIVCSNAELASEGAECQWFLLSQLLEITLHITGLAGPEPHPGT